jgi:MYXO-CTERM domain-containing protein
MSSRFLLPLATLGCVFVPLQAEARRVVYINTDPIVVLPGAANDPTIDTISVNGYAVTSFTGWNGATEQQRQQLLHLLKNTTIYWDVVFTLERPAVGPYDMIVFGDARDHATAFGGACSPQVGIADCDDTDGVSIGFLFWGCLDASKQFDPHRVAFSILGALGYSWGMDNVDVSGQVMGSYSNSGLKYGHTCVNVSGVGNCNHQLCPAGQQNGTAEMVARHGARIDDGPPEVIVLEPAVDALVSGPFDVVVEILDDFGRLSAELSVLGLDAPPAVDDQYPFRWNNLRLPPGPQVLEITATDFDRNKVTKQVPICVDSCDVAGDGDGEPRDGDGEPGTDDDDDEPASGANFVPIGGEQADAGCSCSSEPSGSALASLGLLALLGLRLRPRRFSRVITC